MERRDAMGEETRRDGGKVLLTAEHDLRGCVCALESVVVVVVVVIAAVCDGVTRRNSNIVSLFYKSLSHYFSLS